LDGRGQETAACRDELYRIVDGLLNIDIAKFRGDHYRRQQWEDFTLGMKNLTDKLRAVEADF
jgi:hypothetical protein